MVRMHAHWAKTEDCKRSAEILARDTGVAGKLPNRVKKRDIACSSGVVHKGVSRRPSDVGRLLEMPTPTSCRLIRASYN